MSASAALGCRRDALAPGELADVGRCPRRPFRHVGWPLAGTEGSDDGGDVRLALRSMLRDAPPRRPDGRLVFIHGTHLTAMPLRTASPGSSLASIAILNRKTGAVMKITIYGASDDLVEVDGCPGGDEFYVYGDGRWRGDLIAPDHETQMRVHCWYDQDGCWQVGVGQTAEDYQLPAWSITITQAPAMNPANPGYSALLTIDVPEGTELTNVWPERES